VATLSVQKQPLVGIQTNSPHILRHMYTRTSNLLMWHKRASELSNIFSP